MKLLIPCAAGVEGTVKRQLIKLGYGDRPAVNGRISLEGGWEDVARLNVMLRAGERVLICLAEFPARTFDELYEGVFRIPWEDYLTPHARILIDGKCVKSALMAVKAAGGVAKKAVVNRLKRKLGAIALDEKGERAVVGVSIFNDTAQITLDTSGEGLHKRGYRVLSYDAPLRETTAAALVENTYYRGERPFADLFCGSGTIPVEAALSALGIAPGAKRDFDFTSWKCAPQNALGRAREEAEDSRRKDVKPQIYASDISEKAISVAKYHAERAGVSEYIRFRRADMRNFSCGEPNGILLSNPPYGERLGKGEDLFPLYRDFSRVFRSLPAWSCYFLSAYNRSEQAFGRKAAHKKRLYSADLECWFYAFPTKPFKK